MIRGNQPPLVGIIFRKNH